ncbi:MAG: GNAT family N-acetyltransferase [Acidihalobacter sp.]
MIEIVELDLTLPAHAEALLEMMSGYSLDAMGAGKPLPETVRTELVPRLRERNDYLGVLAFDGEEPAGLAHGFEGFSTFMARPLLNIHDVFVASAHRGQGLAPRMLARLEELARERGCGKLTLEVLESNTPAQAAYRKFGFEAYMLDPKTGRAFFWEKKLA